MWDWPRECLDDGTLRFQVASGTRILSSAEIFSMWIDEPSFSDAFGTLLADLPWRAFRWETPALVEDDFGEAFEFVVVDAPDLIGPPDPTAFSEHFRRAGHRAAIEFDNLGGDARLVAPCPRADDKAYTHLARFVRHASKAQQRALWRAVGLAVLRRAGDIPVWLSTAGAGVSWLHVRLDDKPKYYAHAPYRVSPARRRPG